MPSSPKVPKEKILKAALDLLIREGYGAINIKALAKEIGCSTQPISWHFGNMDGLRRSLTEHALTYAYGKMLSSAKTVGIEGFASIGMSYVSIAFDEPNLFKYLFLNGGSGYQVGGIEMLVNADDNAKIVAQIATQLEISMESAGAFLTNTIIYTHGLATFIASGLLQPTKEETEKMLRKAAHSFLLGTGADLAQIGLGDRDSK